MYSVCLRYVCVYVCVRTRVCEIIVSAPFPLLSNHWNKVGPKIFKLNCPKESAQISRFLNSNLIFSSSKVISATNQLRSDQDLLLLHLLPRCRNCLRWLWFAALQRRLWALGMFSRHRGDLGSASWCHLRDHWKLLFWNIKSAGKQQGFLRK